MTGGSGRKAEAVSAAGAVAILVVLSVLLAPGNMLGGRELVLVGDSTIDALVASPAVIGVVRGALATAVLYLVISAGVRAARGEWVTKIGSAETDAATVSSTIESLTARVTRNDEILREMAARLDSTPQNDTPDRVDEDGIDGST